MWEHDLVDGIAFVLYSLINVGISAAATFQVVHFTDSGIPAFYLKLAFVVATFHEMLLKFI